MAEETETPVVTESAQAERERHDRELAEYNQKRQERLGGGERPDRELAEADQRRQGRLGDAPTEIQQEEPEPQAESE